MVRRLAFRGRCRAGRVEDLKSVLLSYPSCISGEKILTLTLFNDEEDLFLYCETNQDIEAIEQIFPELGEYLLEWPGDECKRYFVPMMDIFHYYKPTENSCWRTSEEKKQPWGRIAKLKPEMVSSYIYYHYQYQEERPGDGDKYGLINLHENLLFFYTEKPETKEIPLYTGKLDTHNTPNNWGEVMDPHFIKWKQDEENQIIWKTINTIFTI